MSLLLIAQVPPLANADPSASPVLWAAGSFIESDRGFFGCVRGEGDPTRYCFAAYAVRHDGEARVHAVVEVSEPPENGLVSTAEPVLFIQDLPDAALTRIPLEPLEAMNRLHLAATIEGLGDVDFTIETMGDGRVNNPGNLLCVGHPVRFQGYTRTAEAAIDVWRVTGSIGGHPVAIWSGGCSTYFVGPTSGAWMMPAGTF